MKRPIAEWRKDLVKRKRRVPVKVMRDGREICTKSAGGLQEYKRRKALMVIRQGGMCGICGYALVHPDITFDHETPRSGGRQDDRIEVDGVWRNAAVHELCNYAKGSRRIPYLPHARNTEQGKMKSRLGDS